jgi:nitrous oxidase accessory protein NosD
MRRSAPLLALLAALALPASGAAKTIDVRPGGLQRAIDRAVPGDTLIVHSGHYRGSFVIDKRLRVWGAQGERRPILDGRCRTRVTVDVAADGVFLRRLHVTGADESAGDLPVEVDFTNRRSGEISNSLLRDTCDAEYGVNVFHSRQIKVIRNRARGFSDAGIYVGGVDSTGRGVLTVKGNRSFRNNHGFILEDSAGGTIRVLYNRFFRNRSPGHGPPSGIFVRNSDGAVFRENVVFGNGRFGVDIDANSNENRFRLNLLLPNPVNVRNLGSGNCGNGNRPDAFPPC